MISFSRIIRKPLWCNIHGNSLWHVTCQPLIINASFDWLFSLSWSEITGEVRSESLKNKIKLTLWINYLSWASFSSKLVSNRNQTQMKTKILMNYLNEMVTTLMLTLTPPNKQSIGDFAAMKVLSKDLKCGTDLKRQYWQSRVIKSTQTSSKGEKRLS